MQLIIIHKDSQSPSIINDGLLRFTLSSEPAADAVLKGLAEWPWPLQESSERFLALPEDIVSSNTSISKNIISYQDNIPVRGKIREMTGLQNWSSIINGRFALRIDEGLIENILPQTNADVIAMEASGQFKAYNEEALITSGGRCIGFRRYYSDSFESVPMPELWPHCIFVRNNILKRIVNGSGLPLQFSDFLEKCKTAELKTASIKIGGFLLDLNTEEGMLNFCDTVLGSIVNVPDYRTNSVNGKETSHFNQSDDLAGPRIVGRVILGSNVRISPGAVVAGPAIIGDNTRIEDGAVITSSIVGPDLLIPAKQFIQNKIVRKTGFEETIANNKSQISGFRKNQLNGNDAAFKVWPKFSYAGFFKRLADVIASLLALLLFLPFFPIIAIMIKLSSRGPVFYKDKRQGFRGKLFNCIKFRTMIIGADNIQDKLRVYNKVDGPQFKMDDDPRVNSVGRFLRATYIDEVPQFINVLLGQMSIVGPRPSPASENELCPFWRYARLSVRPGITGLWQVFGTRLPLKDFQEWIYYDIKYVKELSVKTDLWICYKTASKIVKLFVNHL